VSAVAETVEPRASLDAEMQRNVKRRRLGFLLPIFILLLGGLATAIAVALSTAPSVTAGALSQALGRRVELGKIDVRPGLGIEVEVDDVRVYSGPEPREGELPVVEARRALGHQSWLRLLIGQFVPLEWELDDAVVRVMLESGPQGETPSFPLHALVARNARVEIQTGSFGVFELTELNLEARRRTLLAGITGRLATKVRGMGTSLGRIDASFDVTSRPDQISVSGTLAGLALSRIPRIVPAIESAKLGGQAGGQVDIVLRRDLIQTTFDLGLQGFTLQLEDFEGPIQPQVARLNLGVEWRDGVWTVQTRPLKFDELELQATARIDTKAGGRVRGELTAGPMRAGKASAGKLTALSFMGLRYQTWRNFDHDFEAGTFVDTRFTLDVAPEDLMSTLSYKRAPQKGELFLHTRLVDGLYRLKSGEPLDDMTGVLELQDDKLVIRDLKMRRGESRFPALDIGLDGFARFLALPVEARKIAIGPGTDLSGIGPAFRALARSEPKGETPRAFSLGFSDLQILYPAFILPVHGARGRMRFPEGRFVIDETRAYIGGGAASLDVDWSFAASTLAIGIRYIGEEFSQRRDTGPIWLSGDLQLERVPLGNWTLENVRSHVEARSGVLEFPRVEAGFDGGRFRASGNVDISRVGQAPLRFEIGWDDSDASGLMRGIGLEDAKVTGRSKASGELSGRLDPGASFLRTCDLSLGLELRDGKLENVPASLQLARLPSLQGIRGLFGRPLPYDTISTELELHQGKLQIEELAIQSPDIRVLANGDVDLNTPQREADMLVALLFLRTLDGVLERVPFVGNIILGDDKSLVTLGFRMRGPVASPSFTPEPPATIKNAANFLNRLRSLIPGLRPSEPEPARELHQDADGAGSELPEAGSSLPLGDAGAQ
jgi:hypothetical protein